MALQGTLDTFALPDVLRLLAATKKTGRLHITNGRGEGSLWVDGGSLSAIAASHAPLAVEPVDALFELLRFEEGSFTFDTDATPEASGAAHDIEALLVAAGALLAEWRELEAVVPSLDAWVAPRSSLDTPEVTIGQHHWASLVVVGTGATVGEVGEHLGLPELPVARAIRDLVELGLVAISPRPPRSDVRSRPEPTDSTADRPEDHSEPAPLVDTGTLAMGAGGLGHLASDDAPTDAGQVDAPLPTARPLRARRARGSSRFGADAESTPERFVPLDLPGHGAGAYDPVEPVLAESVESIGGEGDLAPEVDDLAAAFPGLANRTTAPDHGDDLARQLADLPPEVADAVRAAAEAATAEEREAALDGITDDETAPINRGVLLKFLSSVRG